MPSEINLIVVPVLLLVLSLSNNWHGVCASDDTVKKVRQMIYIHQDWHITNETVLHDVTIQVNGSIYVEKGGRLVVHNGVIEMMCTYDRQFSMYWAGGSVETSSLTIGGRFSQGSCFHSNIYIYDGTWTSTNDVVRCSYGILFSEQSAGNLTATNLTAGPSPDSIIMGGRGSVTLFDSAFSLNIGVAVSPGKTTHLDLPANTALTQTLSPSGTLWTLCLYNSSSTHWFIDLSTVVPLTHNDAPIPVLATEVAVIEFSNRTDPFNLHLHTMGLTGTFRASMKLTSPVAIGNVVLQSADETLPASISMWEMYVNSTAIDEHLVVSGIAFGGEQMHWGPGKLTLFGTGKSSIIACTTCNVNGGTIELQNTTIGYIGAPLTAQVRVRNGSKFVGSNVWLNDVNLLAQGENSRSSINIKNCTLLGVVKKDGDPGTSIQVECDD
eukprot:m.265487 g.265487  ORF g.265487 m.265487 type:complete len:438 (+) comp62006_c0_seq1:94-1407(+)